MESGRRETADGGHPLGENGKNRQVVERNGRMAKPRQTHVTVSFYGDVVLFTIN